MINLTQNLKSPLTMHLRGKDSLNSIEGRENIYVEHPDFDLEDVVADVSDVQDLLDTSFKVQQEDEPLCFSIVDEDYQDFKKNFSERGKLPRQRI